MPRGDKSSYTDKQKRQAEHIEEGYESCGVPDEEAARRAWSTVNKQDHGGKMSGSGRGKAKDTSPSHKGGRLGGEAAATDANKGRCGFTYTHYDVGTNLANRQAIEEANRSGFAINLSANSLKQADQLADLRIAPVTVILPANAKRNTTTTKGRTVVICPVNTHPGVTCATCGLCARMHDRQYSRDRSMGTCGGGVRWIASWKRKDFNLFQRGSAIVVVRRRHGASINGQQLGYCTDRAESREQ